MSHFYTLDDDDKPIPTANVLLWAEWFNNTIRTVEQTVISPLISVSTVFLGINHNFRDDDEPILWETMIFGGSMDGYTWRYSSKKDAIIGHAAVVNLCKLEEQKQKEETL